MLATQCSGTDNRSMRALLSPLLISFLLTTTPLAAAEGEETRAQAGVTSIEDQLIEALDPSYELLELDTGNDRYALVFRPAMTPNPMGNLLILPDTGSAEAWLDQSRALADYLPEYGWNLMVLQPPEPADPALPERTLPVIKRLSSAAPAPTEENEAVVPPPDAAAPEQDQAASNTEDSADSQPVLPFPDQYNARFQAAWSELSQRGGGERKLILGIGSSATWAAQFALSQGQDVDLITLNPRPAIYAAEDLGELMIKLKAQRVIDLYYSPLPGYPDAEPDARQRQLLAKREGLHNYHQSRLPGVFRGWNTDMPWMTRQVRGVLERIYETEKLETLDIVPNAPLLQPPQPPGTPAQPQPARGPSSV